MPYKTNDQIRDNINKILALPFIPEEDLFSVFDDILAELHEDVVPLWDYVELNYVRGRVRRNRTTPPRYSPSLWNTYTSVIDGIHRTNNMVEAWHGKFLKMIQTRHSSIWKFIDFIKRDEKDIKIMIVQLEGGHRVKYPGRKIDVRNDEMVKKIVHNYAIYKADNSISTYLRAICYKLKRFNFDEGDSEEEGED